MIAQPNLSDIQCPSLTASSPSIATSAKLTVERTLAETEETVEQNPDFPFFKARKRPDNTPSMSTCWGPEQLFKASRQTLFGPPSQDITTPEKRTAEQMQVAEAIRARGGSGVPFRVGTGIPLAGVAFPMAMLGSMPPAPLQNHPQAKKPKSRNLPTAHAIVQTIYVAALAAAGTNVAQFEEAVRIIYN